MSKEEFDKLAADVARRIKKSLDILARDDYCSVAQLEERHPAKVEDAGSTPVGTASSGYAGSRVT